MSFTLSLLCILVNVLSFMSTFAAEQPNVVFILTDDQDVALGGQTPMTKTKQLIGDAGVIFSNMFTTSPLCCPSRSSIMTGNYVHNHNALNNSVSGNCSSPDWQQGPEQHAFSTFLKKQGYTTFFAGKYLNQYGRSQTGGVAHIPPGWDHWYGLVGNSVYYDYTLSVNGIPEKHGSNYSTDYLTDVINRRATEFLKSSAAESPFFMMLSTPACHAPFTPAPQYNTTFSNCSAPRNGSYDYEGKDKHWLIRVAPNPMSKDSVNFLDNTFRNRWRTLLSVDDMVENVVSLLTQKGILNNTYVFFSSDNGYHLGQFSLPNDKRQLYDFDLRVPLMVRGPGIKPGHLIEDIALNIDFAPTFIDIAGHTPPKEMDGMSILPLLHHPSDDDGMVHDKGDNEREPFLIEHWGEASSIIPGCPEYDHQGMHNCQPDCVCEDAWNNTYGCVRKVDSKTNMKYCIMSDNENFVEMYNLSNDPNELVNIVNMEPPDVITYYNDMLGRLSVCSGDSCRNPNPPRDDTAAADVADDNSYQSQEESATRVKDTFVNSLKSHDSVKSEIVQINDHKLLWSNSVLPVSDKETDHDPVVVHMDREP